MGRKRDTLLDRQYHVKHKEKKSYKANKASSKKQKPTQKQAEETTQRRDDIATANRLSSDGFS